MPKPKIVLWDIETTHNLVAAFQLKNQDYIHPDNIVQERYIVCAAWKELDKGRTFDVSVLNDPKRYKAHPHDDYHVVKTLHDVLGRADVIVAHNGDQYDIKFTEARMLIHGLSPLPPIPSIDTLSTARSRFLFNSNTLDYLGRVLKVGRKRDTPKGLWLKVLAGDQQAIKTMVRYNRGDVQLLERVFHKLQPYVANHVNRQLFGETGCPRCGSRHTTAQGYRRSITQNYQRFRCEDCGGWFRNRKAEKSVIASRVL